MDINFGIRLKEKFLEEELISNSSTEEGTQNLINMWSQLHNTAASDPDRTDTSSFPAALVLLKMCETLLGWARKDGWRCQSLTSD